MNYLKQFVYAALISLSISFLLFCCEEADIKINQSEYFPLQDNQLWEYEEHFFTGGQHGSLVEWTDSPALRVSKTIKGDTVVAGKSYKKLVDEYGTLIRIIRKEGSQYFYRDCYYYLVGEEFKFLDEDVQSVNSWTKELNGMKAEYIQTAHKNKIINKLNYNNVIEVTVNYYGKDSYGNYGIWYSAKYMYVKGVGEIYNLVPNPANNRYVGTSDVLLNQQ
jgi:hypothetical protein